MTRPGSSLLERIQRLLERTYAMRIRLEDIGRFIIGDRGLRSLYEAPGGPAVEAGIGDGSRTLVREVAGEVRVCVYYPDDLVRHLEAHPPGRRLCDANVEAFATFVEELDHLLCIADRVAEDRPVSLFELELHANVSKHLVLTRFLVGPGRRVSPGERAWLRYHLFESGEFSDRDPRVLARYRDAARWAVRYLNRLRREETSRRLASLRVFHREGTQGKLELIRRLAA